MTVDHLRLFRDIASHKSISKGSKINNLSQSAASQHLMDLEREWGVELLDRTTRPLALTPAGKLYLSFCRDVVRQYQEFQTELETLKGSVEGACRVVCIYSVGLSEFPRLEEAFVARYPKVDIQVEYLRPEKVYEAVFAEHADLGVISYPEGKRGLEVIPWRTEQMVVAMSPTHRLAERSVISAADLEGEDYVGFDNDLPISREIRKYFREADVDVNRVMHFDNIQSMKEAVVLGSGISILPEPVLRHDVAQGRLRMVPLEAPGMVRSLGVVRLRKRRVSRAVEAFLGVMQEASW